MHLVFLTSLLLIQVGVQCHCNPPTVSLSQSVDNNGFHRDISWLLEVENATNRYQFALVLTANSGMFVNPYQLADLQRIGELSAIVKGNVNVESSSHESNSHQIYIYPSDLINGKILVTLPIHLRYQRAKINGGFGRVKLPKPSILYKCLEEVGEGTIKAPCNTTGDLCNWFNITYTKHFEDIDLFVPVGNLNDYPLISVSTLLLACIGCIYILSILSSSSTSV